MPETFRVSCQNKIWEINASSWFYYKEISAKFRIVFGPALRAASLLFQQTLC